MCMKRLALLLCLLSLPLCACGGGERAMGSYRVITASDLHYLAPSLTDHGALFTELVDNADGKLMRYIEELTDAFLNEVIAQKPEALILTGDLSFNGETASHEALAEKLRAVEAAGVPVLVVPGNHDLDNASAAAFSGESSSRVPSASAEDFRRIYAAFGYDGALSEDPDSLSYAAALNDTTRVLMLDFNTRHDPCGISRKNLKWVKAQLEDARRAGVHVLAAGHQNLFQQTMFREGYVIAGAEKLAALFRDFDVPLYLSGHLHCQHWKTEKGLTEIATSALSVSPCQYGVLTCDKSGIHYETRETDVSARAESLRKTDPALRDFASYAADYFDARGRRQVPENLALFPYTPEETDRLTEYMVALNRMYFSGDLREAEALDPDGGLQTLWERSPSLYGAYLASIRPDFGMDYRVWDGP